MCYGKLLKLLKYIKWQAEYITQKPHLKAEWTYILAAAIVTHIPHDWSYLISQIESLNPLPTRTQITMRSIQDISNFKQKNKSLLYLNSFSIHVQTASFGMIFANPASICRYSIPIGCWPMWIVYYSLSLFSIVTFLHQQILISYVYLSEPFVKL